MDAFDQPIFITGLPRSGTSMVTGLLAQSGVWVGSTIPGGPSNPKGFFEHAQIREVVIKGILRSLDCDPLGVHKLPPPDLSEEVEFNTGSGDPLSLRDFLRQTIQEDGYPEGRRWAYKEPKLSLLWRIFHAVFPNATWLIVERNTESVIRSCLNTHFMRQHSQEDSFWRELTNDYTARLQQLKEAPGIRVWTLSSDQLMAGHISELQGFFEFADLEFQPALVDGFIDSGFWHY
jgi:hypothetical protein